MFPIQREKMRLTITGLIALFLYGQVGISTVWAAPRKSVAWRTLVIDPGHGGEDIGVRGASGLPEKELSLKLAARLAQIVTRRLGMRVILTREEDISVPWAKRVAIANNNKADLFISLHANADLAHRVQGLAVYFLAEQNWPSSTPAAPAVPELVHWDSAQKDYWRASLSLAEAIHAEALKQAEVKSLGVFPAPLLALKGAAMPAVLIEAGFLSHPREEEKLLNSEYQQLLAEVIFEGILRFKQHENK